MMKGKNAASSVDEYIDSFTNDVKQRLKAIRKIISEAAPDAEEKISYHMPGYKYFGMLVYFAAFKNHIGFYAAPTGNLAFKKELSKYKTGKGSIQFPHNEPLPLSLISRIVKYKVKDNLAKSMR